MKFSLNYSWKNNTKNCGNVGFDGLWYYFYLSVLLYHPIFRAAPGWDKFDKFNCEILHGQWGALYYIPHPHGGERTAQNFTV